MLYKGHIKAGVAISVVAAMVISIKKETLPAALVVAAIAAASSVLTSTMPDLDSKTSRISRKLPFVIPAFKILFSALALYSLRGLRHIITMDAHTIIKHFLAAIGFLFIINSLGHRKIMHSLWPVLASLPLWRIGAVGGIRQLIFSGICVGITFGYISHLWGDMHTVDGCPLLYPLPINFRVAKYRAGKDDKKILRIIYCEAALAAVCIIFTSICA